MHLIYWFMHMVWICPHSQNWVARVKDQDINTFKFNLWGGEEADTCKLLGGDQRMVSIHGGNGLPKVLNVAANSCLSPFAELLPPFCLNPILSCAGLKNETMKLKGLTVTRLKWAEVCLLLRICTRTWSLDRVIGALLNTSDRNRKFCKRARTERTGNTSSAIVYKASAVLRKAFCKLYEKEHLLITAWNGPNLVGVPISLSSNQNGKTLSHIRLSLDHLPSWLWFLKFYSCNF